MKGDDPTEFILYDRFEDYMLECMVNEDYLPASDSGLLAAFRVWICFFCLFVCVYFFAQTKMINVLIDCNMSEQYHITILTGVVWIHQVLDEEKKGYIDVGRLSDLLTKKGIPFRPKELTGWRVSGVGCRCFAQNLCLRSCIKNGQRAPTSEHHQNFWQRPQIQFIRIASTMRTMWPCSVRSDEWRVSL